MDKNYAIFDMDGTLVDSMNYWKNLTEEYMRHKGILKVSKNILKKIKDMTIMESAALFIQEYSMPETAQNVSNQMNRMMEEHYSRDIPLKAGVVSYLHKLSESGVRMCVASTTTKHLMEHCLKQLELFQYFEFLLSCENIGVGKSRPDIYHVASKKWNAAPQEIAVYEDALYAAQTAKDAGYYVVGVFDNSSPGNWNKMMKIADEVIRSW